MRLDAGHAFHRQRRLLVLDGGNEVGNTVAQLLAGFLIRELGPQGFSINRQAERLTGSTNPLRSACGGKDA